MDIAICGVGGRVGIEILKTALQKGHTLKAAFDAPGSPAFGKPAGSLINNNDITVPVTALEKESLAGCNGVIDFSAPSATMKLLEYAVPESVPLVIGTTGLTEKEISVIKDASRTIPIVFSPNMAVGVNLLFKLTEIAAAALSSEYDIEIFEAHHKFKKDAPSGTARRLVEIIKDHSEGLKEAKEISGREGMVGERSKDEIGVFAMRGGDIVGEHTVFFVGSGERIELTHRATSRSNFSTGAVMAIEFLADRGPGLYSMYDVLGM